MKRSFFEFTDPKTGKIVKFSAIIPPLPKETSIPIGGYNPGQVGIGKQASKVAQMTKLIPRKKFV